MKPVLEEFERHNPQYRVRLGTATVRQDIGDPTRFLLGVAGGMPPDLIFFDRFAIVEWASRGAFTDLTPYIERDRDKPDGIRKENFYPIAWDEPIYKAARITPWPMVWMREGSSIRTMRWSAPNWSMGPAIPRSSRAAPGQGEAPSAQDVGRRCAASACTAWAKSNPPAR